MKNSKYKERAKKLVEDIMFVNHFSKEEERELLQAMCQLAEEVEKQYKNPMTFDANTHQVTINPLFRSDSVYYSRKEMEELLQKQRELCATEDNRINASTIRNAKLKID